jgi:hypothetical protein
MYLITWSNDTDESNIQMYADNENHTCSSSNRYTRPAGRSSIDIMAWMYPTILLPRICLKITRKGLQARCSTWQPELIQIAYPTRD